MERNTKRFSKKPLSDPLAIDRDGGSVTHLPAERRVDEMILTRNSSSRPLPEGHKEPSMIQKVRGQASAIVLGGLHLYSEMSRSALSLLHRER